jgi:hypothetical protein
MGPDEFDQHAAERVRDMRDQPILVAAEIEDHAVVADEINGRAELALDVRWTGPAGLRHHRKPSARRSLGGRVSLPELLQRPARDHLHAKQR